MLKVLNLYAGIGGNRKLWEDVEVTAVEMNPKIAEIYKHFFPEDNVIIGDAHQYLLDHYKEYDFIWASPPCPTHSDIRRCGVQRGQYPALYPDMNLYAEIILLKHFSKGLWCIENVIGYYKPLIPPIESSNHYFWTNFYFKPLPNLGRQHNGKMEDLSELKGFNLTKFSGIDKRKTLRNCVPPEVGLHILNAAREHLTLSQPKLFTPEHFQLTPIEE